MRSVDEGGETSQQIGECDRDQDGPEARGHSCHCHSLPAVASAHPTTLCDRVQTNRLVQGCAAHGAAHDARKCPSWSLRLYAQPLAVTHWHPAPGRDWQGVTMPGTFTIVPWGGCSLGPHGPTHGPRHLSGPNQPASQPELLFCFPQGSASHSRAPHLDSTRSGALETIGHHRRTYCTAPLSER
jgi:hypothetical protein